MAPNHFSNGGINVSSLGLCFFYVTSWCVNWDIHQISVASRPAAQAEAALWCWPCAVNKVKTNHSIMFIGFYRYTSVCSSVNIQQKPSACHSAKKLPNKRHTTGASTPCNASCRFCSILQTTRDISVAFSRLAKLLREPRWSGPSSRACHWTPGSCWTNEYPRMCRDLRSPGARSCQHSHENSRATKTSSVHEHDGKAMRKQRTTIFWSQ